MKPTTLPLKQQLSLTTQSVSIEIAKRLETFNFLFLLIKMTQWNNIKLKIKTQLKLLITKQKNFLKPYMNSIMKQDPYVLKEKSTTKQALLVAT